MLHLHRLTKVGVGRTNETVETAEKVRRVAKIERLICERAARGEAERSAKRL